MRKNAGLMIITLLLLVVPALANAWTLAVKVAGGSTANNVKVVYGATTKVLKNGTSYLYPTGTATITFEGAVPTTSTLDGVANAGPISLSSGSHIVSATYAAAALTGFDITQAAGGVVYAQNRNNTWTTTGVTGVAPGTILPVVIAADAYHKIVSYSLDGGAAVTTGVTGAAGQILALSAAANGQAITATYGVAGKVTANLFAPTNGSTTKAVNCSVTASSNDTGLQYAFAVTGPAAFSQAASATQTFSFTPALAGTYTVTATVTSTNGGSAVASSSVVVTENQTVLNQGCNSCHSAQPAMSQHSLAIQNTCTNCHSQAPHSLGATCIGCHSIAQNSQDAAHVNDNNGVRSITNEFAKWSHHVTGVDLQDAHCAACHLEGKAVNGKIEVDVTKHLADATTHLRNADTDADMVWDPANPNHSNMDNFCMSCHDANGATSPASAAIQAVIVPAAGKTASALNPFGDTISNRYDKMQRPSVVNVDDQFDTTNNSHHAVKGARYTGRTRTAGARQIASAATFASNSSATLYGKRSTIYDAGNFNALYTPLGTDGTPETSLGDDSTLHCGDCHTVGQWKPGVTTNAAGELNTVAIGAHGSNNEYMLRNSSGTDVRHTQNAYVTTTGVVVNTKTDNLLVCFNCHSFNKYGSAFNATGAAGGHAGEYASGGRCNGPGNTIPFNGYTTGTATDGTQFESRFEGPLTKYSAATTYVEQNPDFGNIFGIQCANCHNSGVENGFGGIHGSKINTYVDGMGNTTKMERFLPGLGNTKYVPGTLGGITGGTTATVTNTKNSVGNQTYTYTTGGVSNNTNWEQKESKRNAAGAAEYAGAGCYTLSPTATAATYGQTGPSADGGATIPNAFGTWGGCDDHGAAAAAGDHGVVKKIVRPITY